MDNSHQHQHSAWTGGRHPNSSTATSASPDRVLEDTMSRFGSMSLTGGGMGALSAPGGGQQQQQVLPPSLSAPAPSPWGEAQHHQHQQQLQQQQLHQQPQPQQLGLMLQRHRAGETPGSCEACRRRWSGEVGSGGRGPDGIWRDEEGRRLYTEQEMQAEIESERAGWRDRTTSLEANLAKMENDAREAMRRAEQAMSEMAEQLRTAESKTYALSVHLAKSNRPSHLA